MCGKFGTAFLHSRTQLTTSESRVRSYTFACFCGYKPSFSILNRCTRLRMSGHWTFALYSSRMPPRTGVDTSNMKKSLAIPSPSSTSLFRGLYARVAHDLGFDPSHVSRIARGERSSKIIEEALRREINKILASIKSNLPRSAKHRPKKRTHIKTKS
jgi:hypothetical protein